MLTVKSSPKKPFLKQARLKLDKHPYFRVKNQENTNKSLRILENNNQVQNSKTPVQNCIPLKDYKLKLKKTDSLSSSKLIKQKSSIISNIYRPKVQDKDQSEVKNYLDNKNMNLIKENIKKLELNLSAVIPAHFKNPNRNKFHLNGFLKQDCRTERSAKSPHSREQIFVFPNQQQESARKLFAKRKLSLHFDRSKYFNCGPFLKKEQKINQKMIQRTQYSMNTHKTQSGKVYNQKKRNNSLTDETIPIIRQRSSKPKTAGGFLKKYSIQEVCIRPDFELQLNEEDLF